MKGVAIITGANGCMGYEEAKAVAEAGYHVIMACYSPKLAEVKLKKMKEETGSDEIEIIGIDLANLSSVRKFADEVKSRFTRIDLLMNNAGTMETGFHPTVDGLERTISVNYVGPYLLTRLLLPLMGEGSRIVNMSSCIYWFGRLHFPEFFEKGRKGCFHRVFVYGNSKLAITLFTFELAKRVKDRGITVNAADPGVVNTDILTMQMWFDPLTDVLFRPFARSPRKGADTAIHLLLDEEKAEQTGTFNRSNHIHKLSKKYEEHKQMLELWEETEKVVKEFL